ncbi:MAG TPA: guanine deaminase [Steroidobacteraceae bacterium]|nr:guanine deaminase [Steroidobacteraceae bacterium]
MTRRAAATERAFRGTFLHTPQRGRLECLPGALIVVGPAGAITAIHPADDPRGEAEAARLAAAGALVTFDAAQYVLPGMVDLHVHAPQWPQLGTALDLPLEEWLQKFTFPLEARFSDLVFARQAYESLVANLLANGTTTAMYFASIHLDATKMLADICLDRGQRALVGRVAMDNPDQCPAFYRDESALIAERETREFIDYVMTLPGTAGLIHPVITPRFIPSCTDELLGRLGKLAAETACHVQTHCSESDWQHRYAQERYGRSDAVVLDSFGLVSRRTVLAHGTFIDDRDANMLVARGAGVAHCPLSNVYFSDAVFPLRRMLDAGVHVGLGTDISGGASASLLENVRHAVIGSRLLESGVDARQSRAERRRPGSRVDVPTAFWVATAGGGLALDLPIGRFAPGYQFDACVIDARVKHSNLRLIPQDSPESVLQKIVYAATRANITQVWVANRQVL